MSAMNTKITPAELEQLSNIEPIKNDEDELASNSRILQALNSIDRNTLNKFVTEKKAAPGDIIIREGEIGNTMYVIQSGTVLVVKGDPISPIVLARRGAGMVIGEMALLEGQPRSASVIALEHTRMLAIQHDDFKTLLYTTPAIGISLMEDLSARLRESDIERYTNDQTSRQLERRLTKLTSEKAQLEELQQVREETTDLVVHDLRNPLSVIINVLQILEMTLPPDILEYNREILDLAKSAGDRMLRLLHALLDTSRLESGEEQFNFAPIDLLDVINIAVRNVPPTVKAHGPAIKTLVPNELPMVIADLEKIERVLLNLLDNAIKHTPTGGQITVEAKVSNNHVIVSINDTGEGIPEEDRERIFERFSQVGDEKKRRRGFGLGLTFCKLVIQGHNGNIWVESGKDNTGSCFAFMLPITETS